VTKRIARLAFTFALGVIVACNTSERPESSNRLPCTDCEIVLERVGVMSDSFDPGALPDVSVYATRDRAGRIYTIARKFDGVLVFNPDGTLLSRLGTKGSGPGEFGTIRRVLPGAGDSIFVSDWGIGRLTVYAPDLTLARTQVLTKYPDLALKDGRFVISEQMPARGSRDVPVEIIDGDGRPVASLRGDSTAFSPQTRRLIVRRVAHAANGHIWTVTPGRYVLERWDASTGERVQTVTVQSNWFTETPSAGVDERARPDAVIETVWEDAGLVWVVLRDVDSAWTPPPPSNHERPLNAEEYDRTYDWVVEVVNPATGAVVASKRFADVLWSRPGSDVVVTLREATAEATIFDVWRGVLRQR
jgi:hypothetical protein